MSKTSNSEQQAATTEPLAAGANNTIVVKDAEGRLRKAYLTFWDSTGHRLTCQPVKSYWPTGGEWISAYLYDWFLPELAVPEFSAHVTLAEEEEEAASSQIGGPSATDVLTGLSDEQKQNLINTVTGLTEIANGPIQIVALDTKRGTILIRDAALLKTIDIGTGNVLAELQLTKKPLFVDKERPESLGSDRASASSEADETATAKQEKVQAMPDSVENTPAEQSSATQHQSANQVLGESMIRVFRDSTFMTQVLPEESEFTRLKKLSPAERKKEEDRLFNELKYS